MHFLLRVHNALRRARHLSRLLQGLSNLDGGLSQSYVFASAVRVSHEVIAWGCDWIFGPGYNSTARDLLRIVLLRFEFSASDRENVWIRISKLVSHQEVLVPLTKRQISFKSPSVTLWSLCLFGRLIFLIPYRLYRWTVRCLSDKIDVCSRWRPWKAFFVRGISSKSASVTPDRTTGSVFHILWLGELLFSLPSGAWFSVFIRSRTWFRLRLNWLRAFRTFRSCIITLLFASFLNS